jgi:hypothetical protein
MLQAMERAPTPCPSIVFTLGPIVESIQEFGGALIPIKLVFILPIKIIIPPNTFQQHLLKTFSQPKVREIEIDEMLIQIKV